MPAIKTYYSNVNLYRISDGVKLWDGTLQIEGDPPITYDYKTKISIQEYKDI